MLPQRTLHKLQKTFVFFSGKCLLNSNRLQSALSVGRWLMTNRRRHARSGRNSRSKRVPPLAENIIQLTYLFKLAICFGANELDFIRHWNHDKAIPALHKGIWFNFLSFSTTEWHETSLNSLCLSFWSNWHVARARTHHARHPPVTQWFNPLLLYTWSFHKIITTPINF